MAMVQVGLRATRSDIITRPTSAEITVKSFQVGHSRFVFAAAAQVS